MPPAIEEILKELEKYKLENQKLKMELGKIGANGRRDSEDEILLKKLLDQGEQKYRVLFELSPAGIMLEDRLGNILDVNSAMCISLGYEREELLNMKVHDLVVPENYDRIAENIQRVLDGERLHHVEKNIRKDGSISYIELRETKISIENQEDCILVIANDISDRIKFEKSLRASEQRYRTLFESADDAIFLMDGEKFIDCNPTTLKMFGCTRQQIINQPPSKFSPPIQPDGVETKKKQKEKIAAVISGKPQNFEWKHKRIDGTLFDAEVTLNRIELSGQKFVLAIVRDITSRKRAEFELLKSEERYRTLAELAQDVIFIIDKDYRYQYINKYGAYSINKDKTEIIGRRVDELIKKEMAEKQMAAFKTVFDTGLPYSTEINIPIANIDEIWWDIRLMPMNSNNGEVDRLMGISRDITERKRSEEQIKNYNEELQKLNVSKDKFFSILAHDLKSPFTSLLGYSDLIANDMIELSPDETKDAVKNINTVARNIFSLLENLLEWSRIQTGRVEYDPKETDLFHIIRNVIDLFHSKSLTKEIEIINEICEDTKVYADENFVFTVMRNLLSNAIKFSYQGGKVKIFSKKFDEYIKVCVSDEGIGMTDDDMKKLFRIDVHQTKSGTHKEQGTGLGLILCKEYIEKSGGRLSVKSEEGKGSLFCFSLPCKN